VHVRPNEDVSEEAACARIDRVQWQDCRVRLVTSVSHAVIIRIQQSPRHTARPMAPPGNPRRGTQAAGWASSTGPGRQEDAATSFLAADPDGQSRKWTRNGEVRAGRTGFPLLVRITAVQRRLIVIVRSAIKQELHARARQAKLTEITAAATPPQTGVLAAREGDGGDRPITACYIDPLLPRDSINSGNIL